MDVVMQEANPQPANHTLGAGEQCQSILFNIFPNIQFESNVKNASKSKKKTGKRKKGKKSSPSKKSQLEVAGGKKLKEAEINSKKIEMEEAAGEKLKDSLLVMEGSIGIFPKDLWDKELIPKMSTESIGALQVTCKELHALGLKHILIRAKNAGFTMSSIDPNYQNRIPRLWMSKKKCRCFDCWTPTITFYEPFNC